MGKVCCLCRPFVVLYLLLAVLPKPCNGSEDESASIDRTDYSRPRNLGASANNSIKLAFGSCNKQRKKQPLWKIIQRHRPEAFIWLGDTFYADKSIFGPLRVKATENALRKSVETQTKIPEFAAFRSSGIPLVAIYDDHDFGKNDGDKTYKHREFALQNFLDFLGESSESPRRKQKGCYVDYTYKLHDRTIHIILLDNRYDREPWRSNNHDILGPEQWIWLRERLTTVDADITLLGSGLQFLDGGKPLAESWTKFPESVAKLLSLLSITNTRRAFFISGDIHFAEVTQLSCPFMGNPLTDFTSSGMTHAWKGLYRSTGVRLSTTGYRRVAGPMFSLNFGLLNITWEIDDKDPTVSFQAYGSDGKPHIEHSETITHLSDFKELHPNTQQLITKCADDRDALIHDTSSSCLRLYSMCGPHMTAWDTLHLFFGIPFALVVTLGLLLAAVILPVFVWKSAMRNEPWHRLLAIEFVLLAFWAEFYLTLY